MDSNARTKEGLHAFSKERKKKFNQGALRCRCTFGAPCVQQTNNSAIKVTLDKTCLWTITCRLALGLRMIKANPKESSNLNWQYVIIFMKGISLKKHSKDYSSIRAFDI